MPQWSIRRPWDAAGFGRSCWNGNLYEKALEQVVDLFRAPANVGFFCSGAGRMSALRQRHDALNVGVAAWLQRRRRKNYTRMVFETMSRWILQDEASLMPPPSVYMVSKTIRPQSLRWRRRSPASALTVSTITASSSGTGSDLSPGSA
jgi:hypothetical protein